VKCEKLSPLQSSLLFRERARERERERARLAQTGEKEQKEKGPPERLLRFSLRGGMD